ncbi:hypothetical protein TI05_17905 [Achromatium sp. WMS3]|nr:hypothetical protein TI05_17905 [Achromatium sp. WMS3]
MQQAIRQIVDVVEGNIHIKLPVEFTAKRVELIILSADDSNMSANEFQHFLLNSPEMSDEEDQAIKEKREHFNQCK